MELSQDAQEVTPKHAALAAAGALASLAGAIALVRHHRRALPPMGRPAPKPKRGIASMAQLWKAPSFRVGKFPSAERDDILLAFSGGKAGDYPAPYDWATTDKVCGWLMSACSQTAPKYQDRYKELSRRLNALRSSDMDGRDRTLGALWGIVANALGYNLTWNWYQPPTKAKRAQLAAVCAWLGMFFVGPKTATVGDFAGTPVPHFDWSSSPRRLSDAWLTESPAEERRALVYLHEKIHRLACEGLPGTNFYCEQQSVWDGELAELAIAYPLANPERAEAGNLRLVGALARHALVMNEATIDAPDVDAMVVGLVVNIAAVVIGGIVSAAAPQSAGAVVKLAQGIAQAAQSAAKGGDVQAAIGAGVAYGLMESGVVDDIPGAAEAGALAQAAANT